MRTRQLLAAVAVAAAAVAAATPAGALTCHSKTSLEYPTRTQLYICGLYEDDSMLDRTGGASTREVNYWTDAIERFGRIRTVEAFVYSVEYMVEVVGDGYLDVLGREPDPHGLAAWTDALRQGSVTPEAFERALADSGEFGRRFPTAEGVVAFWYQRVLGRPPDTAGGQAWANALRSGTTRGQFVAALQTSAEGTRLTIRSLYQSVLERSASNADVTAWTPYLRANGRARMLVQMAASNEAFATARFV